MKKRIFFAAVLAALTLVCCSCGGNDGASDASSAGNGVTTAAEVDPDALIGQITADAGMTEGFLFTSSSTELGEYLDADLISSYYGDAAESPDFSKVARYCVYIDESDPKVLTDVGLFEMSDPSYGATFMQYLQTRIDDKIDSARAYPDIDVELLKAAVVKQEGAWVYYAVCPDSAGAAAAIADALK